MINNLLDGPVVEYRETGNTAIIMDDLLKAVIGRYGSQVVCDLGGGANPLLSLEYLEQHSIDYRVFDISAEELAKAPKGYQTQQIDLCVRPNSNLWNSTDFMFSRWLVEHIPNPGQFHQNICQMLREGGIALHHFPTLYAPPYFFNKILPETLSNALVMLLQQGREKEGQHGKFPAHYRWCRGPLAIQFRRFESVGFRVVKYIGTFGHSPYYDKIPVLRLMHRSFAKYLAGHPCPWLTSFAYVVLQKDSSKSAPAK